MESEGKMKQIEMKKMGLQRAILSLFDEWKDLEGFLDSLANTPCGQMLQKQKLKGIDLNDGPCDDLDLVLETESEKMKKIVGRNDVLCDEKLREIEGKMKEMEFSKCFIEERAKELELREKKIDDGFKDLEVKKREIALKNRQVDAKLVEIEEQKLKLKERSEKSKPGEKEEERVQVLCGQRFEEIVGNLREVDSRRKYIEDITQGLELKRKEIEEYAKVIDLKRKEFEEYAKVMELKRKELDNGFKELESKKMEFTQKTNKLAVTNISNADIDMNQTKRKRSSYDLRCRFPARTKLPAPQVYQTVMNKNLDGSETFWTCCTSCRFKFMYHKIFVNKVLKCRTCSKNFTAYELDAESIPPESNVHSVKQTEFFAMTNKITDVNMNQMKAEGSTCAEGESLYGSDATIKQQVGLVTVVTLDPDTRAANVINFSESNENWGSLQPAVSVECPYPEFGDFDKDKDEKCFGVDQIWACYDSVDVMPILYGRIRKVFSPDFKLQVTFLKAKPEEEHKINWTKVGLPMVVGKFIHHETIETSKRLMFSHKMHFEQGSDEGTYLIYPRKGQTWAMFKDWDIGWSCEAANHRNFKYVLVEIVSDYKQETGVEICYLAKVEGFVSVFRRVAKNGMVTFQIPSSEMLRFSYNVPSFKLSGGEREGVPAGAFEVDPASLPIDPTKLCQP